MIPRLAETPVALYHALCNLAHSGVVTRYGILYPCAKVEKGTVFHPRFGRLECDVGSSGIYARSATADEQQMFHSALEADRLWVVIRSRPGYGSNYEMPRTLQILHQPLRLRFSPNGHHTGEVEAALFHHSRRCEGPDFQRPCEALGSGCLPQ